MQKLMGQMRAAMERYEMVQPGDKIAVGVSGGKDSLMLLTGLAKLRAFYPCLSPSLPLPLTPALVGRKRTFPPSRSCAGTGCALSHRRTRLGSIIFEERKEENPCSLCARMRRGILHEMAKENGCTTLALGHHFDDAVQTFFMNLFYGGKLGCFSPKSYLSRRDLWMIRPMVFCEERDIRNAAARLELRS